MYVCIEWSTIKLIDNLIDLLLQLFSVEILGHPRTENKSYTKVSSMVDLWNLNATKLTLWKGRA